MSDAVSQLGRVLQTDADTLRMLANNIANAQATGFQRGVPVLRSYAQASASAENGGLRAVGGEPTLIEAHDPTPGPMRQTSGPLDLALEGGGFLVVQGASGEVLTRRGDLRLDATGFLVTHHGERVLGRSGALKLAAGTVVVKPLGDVEVDGTVLDRLRVVTVPSGTALTSLGNDLYGAPEGVATAEGNAALVRQGFLEGSNVQATNEMVRTLETLRHFEAAQHLFRNYDELTQKSIAELGKP